MVRRSYSRLRALFRWKQQEAELKEEIQFHLSEEIEEHVANGRTVEQAKAEAKRHFGNVPRISDKVRDVWIWPWLQDATRDLRFSVRSLVRDPGFTATVVLTLALGLAASTAVFSVFNAAILAPPPYPDPDRVVLMVSTFPDPFAVPVVSPHRFTTWREHTTGVIDPTAYTFGGSMTLRSGESSESERVASGRVSVNFFTLFGVAPSYGRGFDEREDRPGGPRVVVLSDGFWQRQFGRATNVIDQTLVLNSEPYVVVGILPASFDATALAPFVSTLTLPDLLVPLQLDPNSENDAHFLFGAARLAEGVSLEAARLGTERTVPIFRQRFPGVMRPEASLTVIPLQDVVVGNARWSLLLFLAAAACVLLIVCANTACLLLVRAIGRQREFALRAAAGASRGRLVRQMLTESTVLAVFGGVLGVPLGVVGIRALLTLQPGNLPRIAQDGSNVIVDWRILLFVLTVSIGCGVACGLLSAWRAARANLDAQLKSGGRFGSAVHQHRFGTLLVTVEVGLTVVLLIGAALLIRSFVELRQADPGFDAHRVLTMQMPVADRGFSTTGGTTQLVESGLRTAEDVPGVEDIAATLTGPPLDGGTFLKVSVVGRPRAWLVGGWQIVTPNYFEILRIPLLRGRRFTEWDTHRAPAVVVINQALASRFWPDGDPLESRVLLGEGAGPEFEDVPRRIVGIVGDVRHEPLAQDPRPTAYVPLAQLPDAEMGFLNRAGFSLTWVVRTSVPPHTVAEAVREELRSSSGQPVTRIRSMDDISLASTARQRFETTLMTLFGVSALLLAALGVYGVVSYAVQQRRRELGIRLALGSTARDVRRAVLVQGMKPTALGIVLGVGAAFGLAGTLSGFLYGVMPHDGVTFLTVPVTLAAVALAATWLPAARAARIDPAQLVREE